MRLTKRQSGSVGESASQQVAEALAVLLGVRAWLPIWLNGVPILEVKSDSVAAMTMVASMHTRSPHVAVVARELALTLSQSCVRASGGETHSRCCK